MKVIRVGPRTVGIGSFVAIGAVALALVFIRADAGGVGRVAVIVVAALSLVMVALGARVGERLRGVLLLALLLSVASLAGWHVLTTTPPFNGRLLLVGALLAVGGATLLGVLHLCKRPRDPASRVMLAVSIAGALFLVEGLLGDDVAPVGGGGRWEGATLPDSVLGERYAPYSELASYYPTNPEGYFEVDSGVSRTWQLATHAGAARLAVTPGDSALLSLVVDSVPDGMPAAIQVNHPGLRIVAGRRYRLAMRGRAVPARTIHVAVSRAEAPWDGLGLYQAIELQPAWQTLVTEFVATEGSDTARVHVDVGAPAGELWFDDIVLTDLVAGEPVRVALEPRYRVVYRFNGLGCRGPDYAIPKPEGTFRILGLGDSHMLGVGVHQDDVLTAELEALLTARRASRGDSTRYEVINCGVSGYGTREERLFYERIVRAYQPDVVLLGMVLNDDISWVEEVRRGSYRPATRLDHLSRFWFLATTVAGERSARDFSGVPAELHRLHDAVERDGGRLAVFLFRNHKYSNRRAGAVWQRLGSAVGPAAEALGFPYLDAGEAILATDPEERLFVHEVDVHPNQVAHKRAAAELVRWLDSAGMLPSGSMTSRRPDRP